MIDSRTTNTVSTRPFLPLRQSVRTRSSLIQSSNPVQLTEQVYRRQYEKPPLDEAQNALGKQEIRSVEIL